MKLGTQELVVLLLIVVIIFGPTQLPKLTKMFGKSVKGFREGMDAQDGSRGGRVAEDADHKEG